MVASSIDGVDTLLLGKALHVRLLEPLIESFCQDKMSDVSYWTTWFSDCFTI